MIDISIFPIPESHYSQKTIFDKKVPLSVFALTLELTQSPGNLLKPDAKKGFFFFRNESIPKPRPCTILAWDRICRVGHRDSPMFLLPFLPSLRDDDEISSATSERGARLASLSRRSPLHVRDDKDRITWGSVYTAMVDPGAEPHTILTGELSRSNCTESMIVPRAFQSTDSSQLSIRTRMEFLASHGIVGLAEYMQSLKLPFVRRLLLQFLNQKSAAEWAMAYSRAKLLTDFDPASIDADYKDMVQEWIEIRSRTNEAAESGETAGKGKGKNIPKHAPFGDIGDINFF